MHGPRKSALSWRLFRGSSFRDTLLTRPLRREGVSRIKAFPFLMMAFTLVCPLFVPCQEPDKQALDRQYQSAVAHYESGQYAEAAKELEPVLPYATQSPVVHELLGMIYASLS